MTPVVHLLVRPCVVANCAEVLRQALASLPLEGFSSLLQAGLLEVEELVEGGSLPGWESRDRTYSTRSGQQGKRQNREES